MRHNTQLIKHRALDSWFSTPQGIRVARAFSLELESFSNLFSGGNLLQLGSCGDNIWLNSLRFRSKWIISPGVNFKKSALFGSMTALPLERDSVDCVIAPMTLEAYINQNNPIDEMDRVLKPMGYAVVFGVNPWSFWGLALRFRWVSCFGYDVATLRTSILVNHGFINRGYRQCTLRSFYYIPPIKNQNTIEKLEFLNAMGKMLWPYPPGFYCLVAQKLDLGVNLLAEAVTNKNSTDIIPAICP